MVTLPQPSRIDEDVHLSPEILEQLQDAADKEAKRQRIRARVQRRIRNRERIKAQAAYDRMQRGPYLEPTGMGGQWVYIPSDWYHEGARAFWDQIGARFLTGEKAWVRPVSRPYKGKRYTPQQWLHSIRKKFFEFHEERLKEYREHRSKQC
jgi:hypothetical protein